ncbi:IclR family transcriptional regulator [Pseudonocardia sp. H11422]|uniref:IclR family transcriptional regulator n=1 Tax=Pseudonocardia sp. H11422 TaxID=2835866 RepID=UPI001BDBD643|nr:IclR family transcriptional regulator [Pseudonocardia sp. H11422]
MDGQIEMTGSAGSQAVDRATALLTLVVESASPRSFTSLVEELGLAKSTTSRLLQALERSRLVQRDQAGSFRPGALFAQYAARHGTVHDLAELARPSLERISELTGESVNLAVPRGSAVVQIAQIDSRFLLGATNWIGVDVPAHCSALGKVLMAFDALPLPDGELEAPTPVSLAHREQLDRDLAEVRGRGWAVAWEELELGLVAVGAPVRAVGGEVVAAVSVSGPTARITRDDVEKIGEMLAAEVRDLSMQLGHPSEEGAA